MSKVGFRAATEADTALVLAFTRELAAYEKLSQEVVAGEAALREHLFGARPAAEVVLAEVAGEAAGFALYFHNFSTFLGRPGLHLEDLFVRPAFRGRGVGRGLLRYLARIALERGCGRLEWWVLDWNEPAIGFYERLGAQALRDWIPFRASGAALGRLAEDAPAAGPA